METWTVEDQRDYFTLPEIAERYRTTEATVRYWRHVGYGPEGIKIGTRVLYPRDRVEAFDRKLRKQDKTAGAA
jgi:hypothetical protein